MCMGNLLPLSLASNEVNCCSSRYDSEYRSARPERDYAAVRDYPTYRARDYPPGGDRDYGPPLRERDYGAYYSPPRDYPPADRDYLPARVRDYPPGGRDYQLSRADDFDMPPRRYASRCCMVLTLAGFYCALLTGLPLFWNFWKPGNVGEFCKGQGKGTSRVINV